MPSLQCQSSGKVLLYLCCPLSIASLGGAVKHRESRGSLHQDLTHSDLGAEPACLPYLSLLERDGCIRHGQHRSPGHWWRFSCTASCSERLCIRVLPWLWHPLQLQCMQPARLQVQLPAPRTEQPSPEHAYHTAASSPAPVSRLGSRRPLGPRSASCQTACPDSAPHRGGKVSQRGGWNIKH